MAQKAVTERGVCIRVACQAFGISESCYRYERKLDAENAEVANWLMRLTDNHRNWGFGLCYLYLRNVKGYKWNHKRVYRIYKDLELNLRIKPHKHDELLQVWIAQASRAWQFQTPAQSEYVYLRRVSSHKGRCADLSAEDVMRSSAL